MSSGSSAYGALSYNQEKVDKEKAEVLLTHRMIEPPDGVFNVPLCMRSFEPYLTANRRTEKPVLHISLNPDPKDKLSDRQFSDIAREYLQKMGYGDQPYIVYKHEDIKRKHIHIVTLRVDEEGRKIDHNFEHRKSMDVCRELEQKFGLTPAKKKQNRNELPLTPVNYSKGDVKRQIANVIRPVAQTYHFLSLKEYRALLSLYRIGMDEVHGEVNGKPYRGLVYSALNKKGEKTGIPFNASSFGKSVCYSGLEKRMEKSAAIIKTKGLKERSRTVIASAIKTSRTHSEFEKELAKNGIGVMFRKTKEGRIYGATFIDHEEKAVFNGSRLGKEFSANVFNNAFCSQKQSAEPESHPIHEPETPDHQTHQFKESILGGLLNLFSVSSSYDYEEEAFARQLKKKRKKKHTVRRIK